MTTGPPVEIEIRIAAPPEVVFPYLTEPEQIMRWMGEEARVDPVPGGEFWLRVEGDNIAIGNYVEIDPPRSVSFTWGWEGSDEVPPGSSTVRFDLRADADDTVVLLRHTDLPDEWCARHREGWELHTASLPGAVAGG